MDAGDFPRTRLTHSLECAQIGRELGGALGCDPDLVDTACLAHDLGHPPFGHNGESALADVAAACGGFEGNAQSLRLLTRLEAKVPGAGLNLTRATLDATLKYPWLAGPGLPKYGAYADDAEAFAWIRDSAPPGRPCLEAQVMDWADDVAYSVHDLEDGLHAGLTRLSALADPGERKAISELTADQYCAPGSVAPDELAEVFDDLLALPCWPDGFDGGPRSLAALKNLTSELIGRLCGAAHQATMDASGGRPLTRYDADLQVPRRQRLECALLKGVTAYYVMSRDGAAADAGPGTGADHGAGGRGAHRGSRRPRSGVAARVLRRHDRRGAAAGRGGPGGYADRHVRGRVARPPVQVNTVQIDTVPMNTVPMSTAPMKYLCR